MIALSPYSIPGIVIKKPVDADLIMNVVCEYFGIERHSLIGKSRYIEFVIPRHIAMYIIRQKTNLKLAAIGKHFNNRDHSTVVNAIRVINNYYFTKDEHIINAIETILNNIRTNN